MTNKEYNLQRFIKAQDLDYNNALKEIKNGQKASHWIWYIFPQLKGLGYSEMSNYYGIANLDEAKAYYQNEILGSRLIEITKELLKHNNKDINQIMGYIDALKLHSSMTLFYLASNNELFKQVIDKYYSGKLDDNTLSMLSI